MIDISKLTQDEQDFIKHSKLYYTGKAIISNDEFDLLEARIKKNTPDSIVFSIVRELDLSDVAKYLIKYDSPMYSLEKIRDIENLVKWTDGELLFVSVKLDGAASSLVYIDKVLDHAKSGGDKNFGKNITRQIQFMDSVPKTINLYGKTEVRGEIVISKENFELLLIEYEKRGLDKPKSIRNIVAGLLNPKKKHHLDLSKYLTFIAYDIITSDFIPTEKEKFDLLHEHGFILPMYSAVIPVQDIQVIIDDYTEYKDRYSYLTDGLVFSINDCNKQLELGFTDHHPKGKLAYKLEIDTMESTILNIIRDVTRTGKVSVVAEIEPIELSGATIRRVALHNLDYIEKNNINIGARVEILRSGEIIPKIVDVIETNGTYIPEQYCPSCGELLEMRDIDQYCINDDCPGKNIKQLIYIKDVFEFENIGDNTVEVLYHNMLLNTATDFFYLRDNIDIIASLDGFGHRKAELIVEGVDAKRRNIPLHTAIKSIGIPNIGNKVSKELAGILTTIDDLLNLDRASLERIDGFGDTIIDSILNNKYYLHECLTSIDETDDVNILFPTKKQNIESKTFVITGKLSKGRKEITSDIESAGHKTSGSVNKNIDYLVCNEPSNSSKYRKAIELGISIITEDELYKLI